MKRGNREKQGYREVRKYDVERFVEKRVYQGES